MHVRSDKPIRSTRLQNTLQFVKFTLFSASAGIIQIVSFTLLNELAHFPYWPAYLIALGLSVIYNFTINRQLTFRSTANYTQAMLKVFGYYLVFTPASTWWGDQLTAIGWNEYFVLIGTMLINFITEFLFCRFVVYRGTIDSADERIKNALANDGLGIDEFVKQEVPTDR